jgi:hypothetical protein
MDKLKEASAESSNTPSSTNTVYSPAVEDADWIANNMWDQYITYTSQKS